MGVVAGHNLGAPKDSPKTPTRNNIIPGGLIHGQDFIHRPAIKRPAR